MVSLELICRSTARAVSNATSNRKASRPNGLGPDQKLCEVLVRVPGLPGHVNKPPQWSVSLAFILTLNCSGRSATTRLSHS